HILGVESLCGQQKYTTLYIKIKIHFRVFYLLSISFAHLPDLMECFPISYLGIKPSFLFEAISFVMRGLIKISFWVYFFVYPAKELASAAGV
ncbi:MAG: hypothetical protein P8I45_02815, partial [Nitrospinaceae bacterium]|nr:hypothetical protein [Nitrospinaceae bacterium]